MAEAEPGVRVWIDQDLCTGDGLCAEISPDVFIMRDDGLAYVQETATNFSDRSADHVFEGDESYAQGLARIPVGQLADVIEAAEECPGECIFIDSCTSRQ